jgi:ABC-type transport system involved in cytochrome bd biosynthesis fused ATPase/permease subunit
MDPQFIIFDEPSAALDARAATRFFSDVLAALTGKTVLVITHDTQNLNWADSIIEMGDGSLRMTPARVTAH